MRSGLAYTLRAPTARRRRDVCAYPHFSRASLCGLAHGGAPDALCPNARSHGTAGPPHAAFLRPLRALLFTDRGEGADCAPATCSRPRG